MGINPRPIGIGRTVGKGTGGTEDQRLGGGDNRAGGKRQGGGLQSYQVGGLWDEWNGSFDEFVLPTTPATSGNQDEVLGLSAFWPQAEGWTGRGHRPRKLNPPQRKGPMRFMQAYFEVADDGTGSGTNRWDVSVVYIRNVAENRHAWELYPAPRGGVWLQLPYFTDSDLPIAKRINVPRVECCAPLGIRFSRAGTGTRQLSIRRLGTHGGI